MIISTNSNYFFCYSITNLVLSQLRIQGEPPYFLDQTEARRAERKINNFF